MDSSNFLPINELSDHGSLRTSTPVQFCRRNWRPLTLTMVSLLMYGIISTSLSQGQDTPMFYGRTYSLYHERWHPLSDWSMPPASTRTSKEPRITEGLPFRPTTAVNRLSDDPNHSVSQLAPGSQILYFTTFVPTGQCDRGFYCRALITLFGLPNALSIMSGYRVSHAGDEQFNFADVPGSIQAKLAKTTEQEASAFAQLAIQYFQKINYYNCSLDQNAIAAGILKATKQVSTCPNTEDRNCYSSFTVGFC